MIDFGLRASDRVIYTCKYDNLITMSFLRDFNGGIEDFHFKNFCLNYTLTSMKNKTTCHKNPSNLSCTDLILTNCPRSFKNLYVIDIRIATGLEPTTTYFLNEHSTI